MNENEIKILAAINADIKKFAETILGCMDQHNSITKETMEQTNRTIDVEIYNNFKLLKAADASKETIYDLNVTLVKLKFIQYKVRNSKVSQKDIEFLEKITGTTLQAESVNHIELGTVPENIRKPISSIVVRQVVGNTAPRLSIKKYIESIELAITTVENDSALISATLAGTLQQDLTAVSQILEMQPNTAPFLSFNVKLKSLQHRAGKIYPTIHKTQTFSAEQHATQQNHNPLRLDQTYDADENNLGNATIQPLTVTTSTSTTPINDDSQYYTAQYVKRLQEIANANPKQKHDWAASKNFAKSSIEGFSKMSELSKEDFTKKHKENYEQALNHRVIYHGWGFKADNAASNNYTLTKNINGIIKDQLSVSNNKVADEQHPKRYNIVTEAAELTASADTLLVMVEQAAINAKRIGNKELHISGCEQDPKRAMIVYLAALQAGLQPKFIGATLAKVKEAYPELHQVTTVRPGKLKELFDPMKTAIKPFNSTQSYDNQRNKQQQPQPKAKHPLSITPKNPISPNQTV